VQGGKLALLGLALWLAWGLLADLQWEDLAARVEAASRPWLAAALAALAVRFLIWDERWRRAIARVGTLPPRSLSLPSLLAAATVNTVTPTARVLGGVIRARHLSRALGEPMGRAYGSVLYDQLAHQVVIGGVTWLSVIAAAAVTGRTRLAWALAAALAAALATFALWLRRRKNGDGTLARWLADRVAGRGAGAEGDGGETGKLRRLMAHGREAVGVVRRLLGDRRLSAEVVALGVAFFVVNASAQWMVFQALGADVGFTVVLAVVALGAMAGVAVGTPGGVGGAEATMIATFTAFGVGRLDAAAGALLFRAFHFASILALGVPSLVWLEMRHGRGGTSSENTDAPNS
jgi:uncharacterized protein (TIRG00374 family)